MRGGRGKDKRRKLFSLFDWIFFHGAETQVSVNIYLLQNASHDPLALTACRFLPSFTRTCNEPLVVELLEPDDDLMLLPNFRRLRLPPLPVGPEDDELLLAVCLGVDSGGMNFSPTMMSPRYVDISSNGSLYQTKKK